MAARPTRPTFQLADVRPLLQTGLTDSEIGRRLFHQPTAIGLVREALEVPPARRTNGVEPVPRKFARHTQSVGGGHLQWVGPRSQDLTPVLHHGTARLLARWIAYQLEHGRRPVGTVKADCEHDWCVTPAHLTDQVDRDHALCFSTQLDAAAFALGAS